MMKKIVELRPVETKEVVGGGKVHGSLAAPVNTGIKSLARTKQT